jgi:hypothetical protein
MNEEDEAFNEIERKSIAKKEAVRAAMRSVEDDDIQEYKKPWVGLTRQDYNEIFAQARNGEHAVQLAEAKLKEKNI